MKHNFVGSKHDCRAEILLQLWKIEVNLNYNFECLKNKFWFKKKKIDLKYSYWFEIVFCWFQNITADLGNGYQFQI